MLHDHLLLAAVRLGTTLIDDNIWSKLFDPNRPDLGWEDCVDIVDSTTWIVPGLSCGTVQHCKGGIKLSRKMKCKD
eukprot:scaffold10035_cov176-Skeletonema_marinoi.AAC.4